MGFGVMIDQDSVGCHCVILTFYRSIQGNHRMNAQNGYDIEDLQPGMSASLAKTVTEADLILFSGGGGQRLLEVMAAMHPSRVTSMKLVQDPVFSNVRGFHLLGELLNHGQQ